VFLLLLEGVPAELKLQLSEVKSLITGALSLTGRISMLNLA